MADMRVAVQTFSVRQEMQQDPQQTLQRIAGMGYNGIELGGLYGLKPQQMRELADQAGLQIVSWHTDIFHDENFEQTLQDLQVLGCRYVAVAWMSELDEGAYDKARSLVPQIRSRSAALAQAGIQLLYHNHWFEPVEYQGELLLDSFLSWVGADALWPQPDVCWLTVAGVDAAAFIRKYAGRVPIVHIKDFVMKPGFAYQRVVENQNVQPCPAGMGHVPMADVLQASVQAGAQWLVVEQDSSPDRPPMEAIAISRAYLRGCGY